MQQRYLVPQGLDLADCSDAPASTEHLRLACPRISLSGQSLPPWLKLCREAQPRLWEASVAPYETWGGTMIMNIELQRLADDRRDKAARARSWAQRLANPDDRQRLMQYAAGLEAEASEMEWQARSGAAAT